MKYTTLVQENLAYLRAMTVKAGFPGLHLNFIDYGVRPLPNYLEGRETGREGGEGRGARGEETREDERRRSEHGLLNFCQCSNRSQQRAWHRTAGSTTSPLPPSQSQTTCTCSTSLNSILSFCPSPLLSSLLFSSLLFSSLLFSSFYSFYSFGVSSEFIVGYSLTLFSVLASCEIHLRLYSIHPERVRRYIPSPLFLPSFFPPPILFIFIYFHICLLIPWCRMGPFAAHEPIGQLRQPRLSLHAHLHLLPGPVPTGPPRRQAIHPECPLDYPTYYSPPLHLLF